MEIPDEEEVVESRVESLKKMDHRAEQRQPIDLHLPGYFCTVLQALYAITAIRRWA